MTITHIKTDGAPLPAGHYAQGVAYGGLLFVSGQLPIVPGSSDKIVGPIEEQTTQVLKNLEAILHAAGTGKDRVLKVTIYISDLSLWGNVNTVYATFFGGHKPARAIVPSQELHYGYQIELEAIAAL